MDSCCFIELALQSAGKHEASRENDLWFLKELLNAAFDEEIEVLTSTLPIAECAHAKGDISDDVKTLFKKFLTSGRYVFLVQDSVLVAENAKVDKPTPDPTMSGSTFGGWYADSSVTAVFDFNTPITADITLYPKWTVNSYTVSFVSNGGSTVVDQTVNHGNKATSPAPAPTKAGSTLVGWYSDVALTVVFDFNTAITANITLYAKWSLNSYTVSFNSTGGSAVDPQSSQRKIKQIDPDSRPRHPPPAACASPTHPAPQPSPG